MKASAPRPMIKRSDPTRNTQDSPSNIFPDAESTLRDDLWPSIREELRSREFWQELLWAAAISGVFWLLMQIES